MNELKLELSRFLSDYVTEKRLNLFERVLAERTRYLSVVLEDVSDHNDACAVMRSCECFGIQDLHIISQRTQFQISSGVSVGAAKWISLFQYNKPDRNNTNHCIRGLKEKGYRIVAIRAGAPSTRKLPVDRKLALCLGSEALGPSDDLLEQADMVAGIPTAGFTSGFNISVTAALCLADLRARLLPESWPLSDEEHLDLKIEWLAKMPKRIKQLAAAFLVERKLDASHLKEAGLTPRALQLMT